MAEQEARDHAHDLDLHPDPDEAASYYLQLIAVGVNIIIRSFINEDAAFGEDVLFPWGKLKKKGTEDFESHKDPVMLEYLEGSGGTLSVAGAARLATFFGPASVVLHNHNPKSFD